MQQLDVRFLVQVGNFFSPIEHVVENVPFLVDAYMAKESLSCCDFAGGFEIRIDRRIWNDGGIDEFWMTVSWLMALEKIVVEGESEATAAPWEESYTVLRRDGNRLGIEDGRPDLEPAFPQVSVDLAEFVDQVIEETRLWHRLVEKVEKWLSLPQFDDRAVKRNEILQHYKVADLAGHIDRLERGRAELAV